MASGSQCAGKVGMRKSCKKNEQTIQTLDIPCTIFDDLCVAKSTVPILQSSKHSLETRLISGDMADFRSKRPRADDMSGESEYSLAMRP